MYFLKMMQSQKKYKTMQLSKHTVQLSNENTLGIKIACKTN